MDVEIDDYAPQQVSGISLDHTLKHNEEGEPENSEKSTIVVGSTSGSLNSDNLNGSNSDQSYHNNDDADDAIDEDDDDCMYDDDDEDYMYDDDDDADYNSMQAQFDNVDFPPGVEASVSWIPEPVASNNNPSSTSTSSVNDTVSQAQAQPQPQPAWMSSVKIYDPDSSKTEAATSSSTVSAEPSSEAVEDGKADTVMERYKLFPSFDVVEDFSDHYFSDKGFSGQQPPTSWLKKVREDWKSLESNLPETIFVRVYEARMDLLRAIIVGPQGTPYHDGLFVFDVLFPPTYPSVPPMVHYYSGGLRINPNLYNCGKVCLSLLNTWSGQSNEMWMPNKSTMLQVLVSIQGLILNAEPFFNEPGYEGMRGKPDGQKKSKDYSENTFILSLKTMIYTLRKPPKHFEDLVAGHFRVRAPFILSACKAYVEGAELGSAVGEEVAAARKAGNHSKGFKESVSKMINGLVSTFTRYAAATDLDKFRVPS